MIIGLKDFAKEYKGRSFFYKIKEFTWELKYAWERAWRGYDDREVFELNDMFLMRMLPIMKDFQENNIGLFANKTEAETNQIIDEMIELLENSDPDAWTEMVDSYKEEYQPYINEFEKQAHDNQHKFLNLFHEWFDCLWF